MAAWQVPSLPCRQNRALSTWVEQQQANVQALQLVGKVQ